jgi:tetratricopeptide (TPR) repeat protein
MATSPNQILLKKLQQAQLELANGSPAKAIKMLEKLLKPSANNPNILFLIGLAYGKMGNTEKVKKISLRTLKAAPNHHGSLCNLANILFLEDDLQGAQEYYQKALAQKDDEPRVVDGYCKVLVRLGRHLEVIELLDKILRTHPNYARAYVGMGDAYVETGQPEKAFKSLQSALKIDPLMSSANLAMGNLHQFIGNLLVSERYYLAVLDVEENNLFAYIGLATLKRLVGDYDKALNYIDKIEVVVPEHPAILATKADILEHAGRFNDAFEILQQLKDKGQITPIGVTSIANMCFRFQNCDEALELLNQTTELTTTSNVEKSVLHYASGHLLDKLKRYDEAFAHYQLANTMVANSYDEKANFNFLDSSVKSYSAEPLKQYPRSTILDSRPVFILGMPRSGTSLCEQILAAHPDVFGAGELGDISNLAKEIAQLKTKYTEKDSNWMTSLPVNIIDSFAAKYLDSIATLNSTKRYVTDKMPHNFKYIGLISMLFPNARIIHCTRNPLDNILSIYFQNFSGSHRYATNLKNIAHHYNAYNQLMKHWEKVVEIPICTVSYEDMVIQQEQTSRKLLAFCDLEWNDEVLQFHKTKRSVGTASYEQVRQPMYKTSKDRWKNYEQHLGEIKEMLNIS